MYVKIHIPTEVSKFLQGKKTRVNSAALLHTVGPLYLEALPKEEENKEK